MYSSVVSLLWRQVLLKEYASIIARRKEYASIVARKTKNINSTVLQFAPSCYSTHSFNRRLHVSSRLNQKKLQSEVEEVKSGRSEVNEVKSGRLEVEVKDEPGDSLEERSDQQSRLTLEPEPERKYGPSNIPPYDETRITPSGRKLERQAWAIFEEAKNEKGRTKEGFRYALKKYEDKERLYRRGAVEFVYTGLDEMANFGLLEDLSSYKELLKTFPEDKYVPENQFQAAFDHYPRQQQCVVDFIEQMEQHRVCPDDEFSRLFKKRFGITTWAGRRYRRTCYWLPKAKNWNPWPIPRNLPKCEIELALMALRRMCGYVDKDFKYTVWKTEEEDLDTLERTFIASAQSLTQQELLAKHDSQSPLTIEGPYTVWLLSKMQNYFVMKAEPNLNAIAEQKRREKQQNDDDNLGSWSNFWEDEESCASLRPLVTVHEQDDASILGVAVTGSSSKESLLSWVRLLQRDNPKLGDTPILFKMFSSVRELEVIDKRGHTDTDGQTA